MANGVSKEFTREYLNKLKEELNYRKAVERDNIKRRIDEARQQGDLSENADYSAAREDQALNEARISELEDDIDNAVIIEKTKITVKFLKTGEIATYEIAGSQSDPINNVISNKCPLALACKTHEAGQEFVMTTENGTNVNILLMEKGKE